MYSYETYCILFGIKSESSHVTARAIFLHATLHLVTLAAATNTSKHHFQSTIHCKNKWLTDMSLCCHAEV